MNWQEADQELDQRVKNFRYQNPKLSYQEAVNIILEDNVELAAAYNNMDSPRTANIKRQFELDKKLKENPDCPTADIEQYQYRVAAAEFMGWRSASKTYGIDIEKKLSKKSSVRSWIWKINKSFTKKLFTIFPKKKKE